MVVTFYPGDGGSDTPVVLLRHHSLLQLAGGQLTTCRCLAGAHSALLHFTCASQTEASAANLTYTGCGGQAYVGH